MQKRSASRLHKTKHNRKMNAFIHLILYRLDPITAIQNIKLYFIELFQFDWYTLFVILCVAVQEQCKEIMYLVITIYGALSSKYSFTV